MRRRIISTVVHPQNATEAYKILRKSVMRTSQRHNTEAFGAGHPDRDDI